jgi:citrate synthase
MSDMHHYETAISKIVSNEREEELVLRGHRLTDLIANATFAEAVFLMLAGRMPSPGQARTLDAVFTACVDHGVTPAAMLGRAFASYGTSTTAAVASGILMFGDVTGGAGDPLARRMRAALDGADAGNLGNGVLAGLAREIVAEELRAGGRVPGFGIPAHRADPRAPARLRVAAANGTLGVHCRLLVAMEDALAEAKGRRIPINLDGIVAALVLDLGLPLESAAAFVMIPRSFSTLAHYLEERAQNTRWRHVPADGVTYTGPMPSDVREGDR